MTILVLAAHPDDEVLGCGGTIARLAREGHDVYIAILGEGITSRYPEREKADRHLVEWLRQRSRQVAELLGAKGLLAYNLPDNRFDTVPLLDVVKLVEGVVERVEPHVVFTHHDGDLNVDHAIVHRAAVVATRPIAGLTVRDLYAFEVPSSTEWSFGSGGSTFMPNVFFDVSETLEAKLAAMALYESEVRPFPFPRSPEALRAIAHRWGSVAGLEAAEAFRLLRSIR